MVPTMSVSKSRRKLLTSQLDPFTRDHLVQFYENEEFLYDAVTIFVGSGLENGDGIVIIATESHRRGFEKHLRQKGFDLDAAKKNGQLILLDAVQTMELFMVGGMPDSQKFKTHVGGLIEKTCTRHSRVRAYGEMVNILWTQRNLEGTIGLEALWNDLVKTHALTLLCGYEMSKINNKTQEDAFIDVCACHSQVMSVDDFTPLKDSKAEKQMIKVLQQHNRSLQMEIEGRKQIEKALQEALLLRSEFLSIAGHELKTPLTALKLQVQMMQRALAKGNSPGVFDKLRHAADISDNLTVQLKKLIDQLLDVTRIRSGKLNLERTEVDLSKLTKEVVEKLCTEISVPEQGTGRVKINIDAHDEIVGYWDQNRVEQIITNLLTNAIKYGEGKPIDVQVHLDQNNRTAKFSVRDNGIGIDPKDQVNIFKRFERASSVDPNTGLGLGLYIVHQVVDAHEGTIKVESQLGGGSNFVVELPLGRSLQAIQ